MDLIKERKFKLWDFNVSHQQLLIRSPKPDDDSTNVDICFWDVAYLDTCSDLGFVSIVSPTADELVAANAFRGLDGTRQVFVLEANGRRNIVVAFGMKVSENRLERMEGSLEYFHRPG